MQITSIIAIYALIWVMSAFLVMPFGLRTPDESGEPIVSGHADSAPTNFQPRKIMLRATLLAAAILGVFYANYVNGWVETQDLNIFGPPPE
ncbi:MAG: DUF1467 family protein [Alphaproteobacteria bacterium]|nr:DUF1467 family protein [Alphaproteobacteria bacterium]